jgi:hypothetical protein
MLYRGNEDATRETITGMLARFANMFLPGIKITLICRHVSNDTVYACFTEDADLEKVKQVIGHYQQEMNKRNTALVGFKRDGE